MGIRQRLRLDELTMWPAAALGGLAVAMFTAAHRLWETVDDALVDFEEPFEG